MATSPHAHRLLRLGGEGAEQAEGEVAEGRQAEGEQAEGEVSLLEWLPLLSSGSHACQPSQWHVCWCTGKVPAPAAVEVDEEVELPAGPDGQGQDSCSLPRVLEQAAS